MAPNDVYRHLFPTSGGEFRWSVQSVDFPRRSLKQTSAKLTTGVHETTTARRGKIDHVNTALKPLPSGAGEARSSMIQPVPLTGLTTAPRLNLYIGRSAP